MRAGNFDRLVLEGRRPYLWIAAVAFLLYAVTLTFGLTHLDDNEFIIDNQAFLRDPSHLPQAFAQSVFANTNVPYYRPFLTVSFMADALIGGTQPAVYHATNVLFHAIVSCLVMALCVTLLGDRFTAFVFGLLFCVHPALAPAVAWIPGRNDLLLGIFAVASMILFVRYCRSGRLSEYLGALALFGCALFTKESAVILGGLFILFMYFERQRSHIRRDEVVVLAGLGAVTAFWFLARSAAFIFVQDRSTLTRISGAVMASLPAYIQYVGKIVFPVNLSVYPTIRDTTFLYGWAAVCALVLFTAVSRKRDGRMIFFGAVWFTFFLVATFIRPSPECVLDFQEHRLYVPLAGFCIMLGGMGLFRGPVSRRTAGRVLIGALVAVFAVLTLRHEMDFRDRWSFWSNAAGRSPHAAFVQLRAGHIYYLAGKFGPAEELYDRAVALDPDLPSAYIKRGLLYLDTGRIDEAAAAFRQEIRISPQFDMGYMCLGVARYRQGRPEEAEWLWKRALRVNPFGVDARKNLAVYYFEKGDKKRAAHYARQLRDMGVPVPSEYLDGA